MTDTERTFGVPVLKKSLKGQRIQDKWKGRQFSFNFRNNGCLIPYSEDEGIPMIQRINNELNKKGSHS
jgi:hypothetical protein